MKQRWIRRQEQPSRIKNLPGAAVIAVEHDGLGNLVVTLEPNQDGGVGSRPRKDRLFFVTNSEKIVVTLRELCEHVVLGFIEILKLVHQDTSPLRSDPVRNVRMIAKEFCRSTNKVIEVEEVAPLEDRVVSHEQGLVICSERITLQPPPAELGQETEPTGPINTDAPKNAALVRLVGDAKAARNTDGHSVLSQDPSTQRVQCSSCDVRRSLTQGIP